MVDVQIGEGDFNSAKNFVCELRIGTMERIVEPSEEISFFEKAEFVKTFWSLRIIGRTFDF